MGIANVNLTDTFGTWMSKTNQVILYAGQLNAFANLIFDTTNADFNTTNACYTMANADYVVTNIEIGRAHV